MNVRGFFSASSVWGGITVHASWKDLTLDEANMAADLLDARVLPLDIYPERLVSHGEIVSDAYKSEKQ